MNMMICVIKTDGKKETRAKLIQQRWYNAKYYNLQKGLLSLTVLPEILPETKQKHEKSPEKAKAAFIMNHKDTEDYYEKLHWQGIRDQKTLKLRRRR